jgi:arylsulfatase A-like enzyme
MKHKIISIFALIIFSTFQLFAQTKPNVVLILADDLRQDALGCYGNTYVKTPNIDKIAANGTRFTNAYICGGDQGAICSPSRAMLMTGKSYHRISNKVEGEMTLPKMLTANGYETFMTGKWHNEKEGVAEGFSQAQNIMFGGMDDHYNTPMQSMNKDKTFTEIERKGFSTDVFTNTAISFLEKQNDKKPFFLYLPYTAPHDPRSPESKYIDMYEPNSIPIPANFKELHPFSFGYEMGGRDEFLSKHPRTPEDIRNQLADYYALVSHMDDAIGKVLNKLKEKGLDKNTIVIFAADNGLALGSHGLMGKQNLYEHSMKVPLIFSGLSIPKSQTNSSMTYLLDIFPTVSEYVGLKAPEKVDGISLKNVIQNKGNVHRNSILTAYIDAHRAVRNENFKLIVYPKINHKQLFDLKNDPHELVNLAEKAEYKKTVEELTMLMKSQQNELGDSLPLTAKEILPKEWDYKLLKRVPDKWQPKYTLDKYFKQ